MITNVTAYLKCNSATFNQHKCVLIYLDSKVFTMTWDVKVGVGCRTPGIRAEEQLTALA